MGSVRLRLFVMMFLQYFVWGAWGVSAGGYMGGTLKFSGDQIGWIYSTTAIGAILAPLFVGYVADRLFATEKILFVLHGVGGVLLCVAASMTDFAGLMGVMSAYALCFMPTLALTNSISMQNVTDPEREFPAIRVWGTIGWIVAGIAVGSVLGGTKNTFFYLAGVSSLLLAVMCLALPHTPPKGRNATGGDVLGLGALGMLKEPSFAVFAFCSFLICIPLSFYYSFANQFLTELDRPTPTALQTTGQLSEIFFMAAMPIFIRALGIKKMLVIGMLAWVARYVCFATLDFSLSMVGLVLHGVCYDFFFVASQLYVDKKAARDVRASAQSLIAFITLGLGMFVGAQAAGFVVNKYPAVKVAATGEGVKEGDKVGLPNWASTEKDTSAWRYLDVGTLLKKTLEKPTPKKEGEQPAPVAPDFARENDKNQDGKLQRDEIPALWTEKPDAKDSSKDIVYKQADLLDAFDAIDADKNGDVTRAEWRKAQANVWETIWLWPAAMAAAACLIFILGFRDKIANDG